MSKALQDLAQGDVDTDGEEDAYMVLMSNNPTEERPVPEAVALVAPQPMQQAVGPTLAPSFLLGGGLWCQGFYNIHTA